MEKIIKKPQKQKSKKTPQEREKYLLNFTDIVRYMNTDEYLTRRMIINREIQKPGLIINKDRFKQTMPEKVDAANAKYQWKKEMRDHYGRLGLNWKKYHNTSNELAE